MASVAAYLYVCARTFLHTLRSYKEMTCLRVEMCVGNTGKQNTCQMSWHFCSQNTNLGWQYQMNPDMCLPGPPSPTPACLSTGSTTWLTALSAASSPWHPDSQLWLPEPGPCHSWPAVCTDILQQQQQQMTRWDSGKIYSSFFCMEHCQKEKNWPFIG